MQGWYPSIMSGKNLPDVVSRRIKRFERAVRAHEHRDVLDHAAIDEELRLARQALKDAVMNLIGGR